MYYNAVTLTIYTVNRFNVFLALFIPYFYSVNNLFRDVFMFCFYKDFNGLLFNTSENIVCQFKIVIYRK